VASHEILTVFAQIAAAFAGFGGLAGLFAQRLEGHAAALAAARLRAVIEWSLIVVAFALVPLVVLQFVPDESGAWRVLSAALALSAMAHRLWVGPKLHDLPWGSRSYRGFTYLWLFGTALLLLANTLGLLAPAVGIYLCGLLSYLLFAMLLFARLLQSLI
jgi:hypothetical protein